MPNDYFQFKQFTVYQEHCAMKVCTDACLFGAWLANKINSFPSHNMHALDIGTGTGLLSLMLAQEFNGTIDAIELDENAAEQAAENFSRSPWSEKLTVLKGDVRELSEKYRYDFIFSNPPFFKDDLKSEDANRNLALHSSMLTLTDLIKVIKKHLHTNGKFALLLPYHRMQEFIQIAEAGGFYVEEIVQVKQTPKHGYFRAMLLFNTVPVSLATADIIIKEADQYTSAFTSLLKNYYLAM